MTSEIYDDIIGLILDFVCTDDSYPTVTRTLAACRRVCKRMAILADPHFFQSIHLVLKNDNETRRKQLPPTIRIKGFCNALQKNPSIATFIRHFSITTFLEQAEADKPDDWIHNNAHIPIILSKLKRLTHFSLINCLEPVVWSNLSEDMSNALQDLYMIPTLLSLDLQCVNGLPVGWITKCENLTSLGLVGVGHGPQEADIHFPDIEMIQSGRVKRMEISTRTFYPLLAEFHEVYALRFFATTERVKVVHDHDGSLNYVLPILLQGVAPTLKEIEVAVYDLAIIDWIWIGGLGNYDLEVLEKIKIVHPFYRVDSRTMPEVIPWLLGHPHQASQTVHTIHIAFIPTKLPENAGWRPYERADWARIDPIVQRLYPALTTFILDFQDQYFVTRPSRKTVEEHMMRMIPLIAESASIKLQVILPNRAVFEM